MQPAGRGPGRGGGRGGRGTPYVTVFVYSSFIPPAGIKYCWFHCYKGNNDNYMSFLCADFTSAQRNAKTHSLQSTI